MVLELTVRADGTVDSVTVISSTYPGINDSVVRFLESCSYQPARSESGRPVGARVEVQFAVARVR